MSMAALLPCPSHLDWNLANLHCRRARTRDRKRGAWDVTPTQIELIRASWTKVEPIADTAANLFYGRLFTLDPSVRPLFSHTDMDKQRKVLMQTLAVVVKSLDKLEQLVPAVQALGRRHAGYGARAKDLDTVGAALLWTLDTGLGRDFDPDTREAWATAYGVLASVMIDAMAEVEEAPAA
jgi:hemoglobin-like flavoprotein